MHIIPAWLTVMILEFDILVIFVMAQYGYLAFVTGIFFPCVQMVIVFLAHLPDAPAS
jgi:hypothetical protein